MLISSLLFLLFQSSIVNCQCLPCYHHIQPNELSSYFNEDYSKVIIEFELSVELKYSSCESLFLKNTLDEFGISPKCVWSANMSRLSVTLGTKAQVNIGSQLWFQKNSLLTSIQECGDFCGPFPVVLMKKYDPPPIYPTAIITGPSEVYTKCSNFYMTGINSQGGYGRDLEFKWQVQGVAVVKNSSISIEASSSGLVNVTLLVKNWLGLKATAFQVVPIIEGEGLVISYDFSAKVRLKTTQSKSVLLVANQKCGSQNVSYEISKVKMNGADSYVDHLLYEAQRNDSKFYIPKSALGPGFYDFLITGKDEFNRTGYINLKVFVEYSDLLIDFRQHLVTVDSEKDLELSGVVIDPDQTKDNIFYMWTCFNGSDCSYIISNASSQFLVVYRQLLVEGAQYSFSLQVSKGHRSVLDFIRVLVKANSRINITFPSHKALVNPQEDFTIKLAVPEGSNYTYEWAVTSNGAYKLHTGNKGKDLAFVGKSMTEGELYSYQVNITENNQSGLFGDSFFINRPPFGGLFFVYPDNGLAEETVFQLSSPGWVSEDGESFSLSYQFGYYYLGNKMFLNIRNDSFSFFTVLPEASEGLTVFVRVYDQKGAFTEARFNIVVNNNTVNQTHLMSELSEWQTWQDSDVLPGKISKLLIYSLNGELDIAELLKTVEVSLSAFRRIFIQEFDSQKIEVVLSLLKKISLFSNVLGSEKAVIGLLDETIEVIRSSNITLTRQLFGYYLAILSNVYSVSDASILERPDSLDQMTTYLKKIGSVISPFLALSQSFTSTLPKVQVAYSLISASSLPSFASPLQLVDIKIPEIQTLPLNILTMLVAFNSNPVNTSSEFSSAVDFTIIDPNSAEEIEVKLKSSYISLTFPLLNGRNRLACVYWTGQSWSDSGCYLAAYSANQSTCKCSHTSLFSSGSQFIKFEQLNTQPMAIIISSIASCLWVLMTCCFIIKDKEELLKKIVIKEESSRDYKEIGRILETELAEKVEKVEKESVEKSESSYLSTAKIGVVNAYFLERGGKSIGNFDEFGIKKRSSLKKKGLYSMKSMYEGIREIEAEEKKEEMPSSAQKEINESEELKKNKEPQNPNDSDHEKDPPDAEGEPEGHHVKRSSEFIPRVVDIEVANEKLTPKFAKSKKITHFIDDSPIEIIKDEVSKPEQKELVEKTDIFQGKKSQDPFQVIYNTAIYSPMIVNYYFSSVCYYHENYSRSSRLSQFVISFLTQIFLQGVIIFGSDFGYIESKGRGFRDLISNFNFQDVAVVFCLSIVVNAVVIIGIIFCKNRMPAIDSTEKDRANVIEIIIKKEVFRFLVASVIIVVLLFLISCLELNMTENDSVFWFICIVVSQLFDFYVMQSVKVLFYWVFGPGYILPSD